MSDDFLFSWQNINVTALEKTKTFWRTHIKHKTILDNVSGTAKSNSLYAVLGSSGSGKTTLLRAISGRCREKIGVLLINKKHVSDEDVRDMSGYVPQEDIFTEQLTVLEHMKFMAALRTENRKFNTEHILSELALGRQQFTQITNLSGGEKRRLTLASELISNPVILFCDEPTTGLDSYNSVIVVEKLHAIALSGKLVLITIHQPSSQIFRYFDNITLIAEGKLVFQGTREEAKVFFESASMYCPQNYNPADFYIKCLSHENIPKIDELFQKRIIPQNKNSIHYDDMNRLILGSTKRNTYMHELKWLLWRNYLSITRNKGLYLAIYFILLIEIIVVSFFYSDVSFFDKEVVQDIEGFLGFMASEFVFTNMYSVVNVFPSELQIFTREKTLYSCSAYYSSKLIALVPLLLFSSVLYMAVIFTIVKFLNGFVLWVQMTYVVFLVSLAGTALGLAFSTYFSTVDHIDLYLGPLEFLLLLLSGLLVRLDVIPLVFKWIKYVSPFYYAFNSMSNLVWRNVTSFGNSTGNEDTLWYNNGTEVLQIYGIYQTYDVVTYNVLYLHILAIVLYCIGFVGILRQRVLYSI